MAFEFWLKFMRNIVAEPNWRPCFDLSLHDVLGLAKVRLDNLASAIVNAPAQRELPVKSPEGHAYVERLSDYRQLRHVTECAE